MKYALLIYATPGAAGGARPADDGVIDSWLDYTAALKESGVLLGAEQLAHIDTATSVTQHGGDRLLTDGPFMETKETIGGFAVLDVTDLDAAIDIAKSWPAHSHRVEIRPIVQH